jgi:translation initiation factor IF-3
MTIFNKRMTRVNRYITAPTVRVKRDGEHLGIMPTYKAWDLAWSNDMDLVEVSAGDIPVCEIMDYKRFQYEEKKKKKEQQNNSKNVAPKEIRLRPVSGDNDVEVKINQLKKFLNDKHPVSVNIVFRSREMQHKDRGFIIMNKILASIQDVGTTVSPPKFEGTRLSVRLVPKTSKD